MVKTRKRERERDREESSKLRLALALPSSFGAMNFRCRTVGACGRRPGVACHVDRKHMK